MQLTVKSRTSAVSIPDNAPCQPSNLQELAPRVFIEGSRPTNCSVLNDLAEKREPRSSLTRTFSSPQWAQRWGNYLAEDIVKQIWQLQLWPGRGMTAVPAQQFLYRHRPLCHYGSGWTGRESGWGCVWVQSIGLDHEGGWNMNFTDAKKKRMHGPTSSPVSVCEKMSGEEFLFFTTLASNTTGCEHWHSHIDKRKIENSIGQRPSGCSAAQRDAPRLLNREFIEKRLTRDTHKYRELFKTDIPLMPRESWKVLTFHTPLQVISLNYLYYCLFMSFFKSHWCFAKPVT